MGKWRVDRQPKVRAGPFQVGREGVGGADDRVLPEVPGYAQARLEVCDAVVLVVQRAAVAVLSRDLDLAANQAEVRLPVIDLYPGRVQLPTQAEIDCQVRQDVPVVGSECREDRRAMSP